MSTKLQETPVTWKQTQFLQHAFIHRCVLKIWVSNQIYHDDLPHPWIILNSDQFRGRRVREEKIKSHQLTVSYIIIIQCFCFKQLLCFYFESVSHVCLVKARRERRYFTLLSLQHSFSCMWWLWNSSDNELLKTLKILKCNHRECLLFSMAARSIGTPTRSKTKTSEMNIPEESENTREQIFNVQYYEINSEWKTNYMKIWRYMSAVISAC